VRLRLLPSLLVVGTLAGCGASPYQAVSDSAMPRIDGVSVVGSQGFDGNRCCEPNTGTGEVWLTVPANSGADAAQLVGDGFAAAGWEKTPCLLDPGDGALPSAAYDRSVECLRRGGMFARIAEGGSDLVVHRADAVVWFERTLDT